MKEINRRNFLKISSVVFGGMLGGLSVGLTFFNSKVQGRGHFAYGVQISKNKFAVIVSDSGAHVHKSIPVDFIPHSIIQSPINPNLVIVLPIGESKGAILDIEKAILVKNLYATDNNMFMGHGIFTPDNKYFIASESSIRQGSGFLVLRDADQFKLSKQISSDGFFPHEMVINKNNKELIVANAGVINFLSGEIRKLKNKHQFKDSDFSVEFVDTHLKNFGQKYNHTAPDSHLTFFDIETFDIKRKYTSPSRYVSLTHISQNLDGDLLVGTKNFRRGIGEYLPVIYLNSKGLAIECWDRKGELSSSGPVSFNGYFFNNNKELAFFSPDQDDIFIYNKERLEITHKIKETRPNSLIWDGEKNYFVSRNGDIGEFNKSLSKVSKYILMNYARKFSEVPNFEYLISHTQRLDRGLVG